MSIKRINDIACYGWVPDFMASEKHELKDQNDAIYGMNTRIKSALDHIEQLERITQVDDFGCILTTQSKLALSLLKAEILVLQKAKKKKDKKYTETKVWPFEENQ